MNTKFLASTDTIAANTSLTIEEILILTKEGVFIRRFSENDPSTEYDPDEVSEAVRNFDKLIVTRDGLDPSLGYKISWPVFDALHPGEGQIKPVGYDWPTGRALFRFSDILAWRKAHGFNPVSKKISASLNSPARSQPGVNDAIPGQTKDLPFDDKPADDADDIITIYEACSLTGISETYIRNEMNSGSFPERVGTRPDTFRRDEVLKWFEEFGKKLIAAVDVSNWIGAKQIIIPQLIARYGFPKPDSYNPRLWELGAVLKWKAAHLGMDKIFAECCKIIKAEEA